MILLLSNDQAEGHTVFVLSVCVLSTVIFYGTPNLHKLN